MKVLVRVSLLSLCTAVGVTADTSLASPESERLAVPAPTAADSPDQVVMDVARGLSEGRPVIAWDALPASYQDDITELVHAFGAKVDGEVWNQGFAIVRKLGGMLQNQKDNILGMPEVRSKPGFDAEEASRDWELFVAPVLTISRSDLADVSTMRTMDVRDFLATTGAEFMQDIIRISESAAIDDDDKLAALGRTKATLVGRDGDFAIVKIEVPGDGRAKTEPFVRVEGKWIPEEMAEEWDEAMGEAREHIAQMSPEKIQEIKPRLMLMLASIETTVDHLDRATSPQQFEQTLQMGVMQAFGGVMELAQAMEE